MRLLTKLAALSGAAALVWATASVVIPVSMAELRSAGIAFRASVDNEQSVIDVRLLPEIRRFVTRERRIAAHAGERWLKVESARLAPHASPVVSTHFWIGSRSASHSWLAVSQNHSQPTVEFIWQIGTPSQLRVPEPAPRPPGLANELRRFGTPQSVREADRSPSQREIADVEAHLRNNLSRPLYGHFQLFLYVSKAAHGPWAQRMYVFEKLTSGDLRLLYDWPVSTGLEHDQYNFAGERISTHTPAGYYELDPHRFYRHHVSAEWREPMPYAMFFNWESKGELTGLAIHAAHGSGVAKLGTRASSGCVRLPPEAARTLFALIRTRYRGLAPRFAVDPRTHTMSNDGVLLRNARGDVELARGYKVLVFIENYGGENFVAAMY